MPLSHLILKLLSGEPLTREARFQIALAILRLAREAGRRVQCVRHTTAPVATRPEPRSRYASAQAPTREQRADPHVRPDMRLIIAFLLCAAPLAAQTPDRLLRVRIPETGAAARQSIMAALTETGFPLGTVAACDCAITTGTIKAKTGFTEPPQWVSLEIQIQPDSVGSVVIFRAMTNEPTLGWNRPGMPPTVIPFAPDSTRRAFRSVSRPVYAVVAQLRTTQ